MNDPSCGAKTRVGTPCKRAPKPNGRCNLHGGSSLAGVASPEYRHGRYSKYIPDRLAARYQEARDDSELISLRDELALLDLRIGDLVQSLDTGESKQTWLILSSLWVEYLNERNDKTEERISELVKNGLNEGYAWNEIVALADERRKLADGERKRLVDMNQMVTAEKAMTFVGALVAIVREHVEDRETLARISADIQRLMVADGGRTTGGLVSR